MIAATFKLSDGNCSGEPCVVIFDVVVFYVVFFVSGGVTKKWELDLI